MIEDWKWKWKWKKVETRRSLGGIRCSDAPPQCEVRYYTVEDHSGETSKLGPRMQVPVQARQSWKCEDLR
jgi:hypothetical protein